jgi:hypothetical protein
MFLNILVLCLLTWTSVVFEPLQVVDKISNYELPFCV